MATLRWALPLGCVAIGAAAGLTLAKGPDVPPTVDIPDTTSTAPDATSAEGTP